MKRLLKILVLISSGLLAQSFSDYLKPSLEWSFQLRNGYDNNVLRLSSREKERASLQPQILGKSTVFDSHFYRLGTVLAANYRLSGRDRTLQLRLAPGYTNYTSNGDKNYFTLSVSADYSWGPYRHLKLKLRYLDDFHLRYYTDKDVSNQVKAVCSFSDLDHSAEFSTPLARRTWVTISAGYLQRYYAAPFTEFDLDIYYGTLRLSSSRSRLVRFAAEIRGGQAKNQTFGSTARASQIDRGYRYYEIFIPIGIKKNIPLLGKPGLRYRSEYRKYDVESLADPLHSGRSHNDSRIEFWTSHRLSETVSLSFNISHRIRNTDSSYQWVKDLKSYRQLQSWISIDWQPQNFLNF